MRSAFPPLLLLSLIAAPLRSQQLPAARPTVLLDRAAPARIPESLQRPPLAAAPPIKGQYWAGLAGTVVGAAIGVTTGLLIGMGTDSGDEFETAAVVATGLGILGGATYGVYRFSAAKGADGRAAATFGGAALGLIGGPFLWFTVPLGARWAYNRSRTDVTIER
jgi:hypothetical protein